MRHYIRVVLALLLCFSGEAAASSAPLTINLPAPLLAETVGKALPFEFSQPSDSLHGTIIVDQVSNLELGPQSVSADVVLLGRDIQIATELAGQTLRLNVGTVRLATALTARIRYDKPSRTLFITPQAEAPEGGATEQNQEVGALLVNLINNREFPVAIGELQPLTTIIGNKQLIFDLQLDDIVLTPEALVVSLRPTPRVVEARPAP